MFRGWLNDSTENEIQLEEIPLNPKLENLEHQWLVTKAVLKRPEANKMMEPLGTYYSVGAKQLISFIPLMESFQNSSAKRK